MEMDETDKLSSTLGNSKLSRCTFLLGSTVSMLLKDGTGTSTSVKFVCISIMLSAKN